MAVKSLFELGFPWTTFDPFLFCVHHDDAYPQGNDAMGPAVSLRGRNIGMDFEGIDGWRMYHGDVVPGFPRHPHRGFETVTICRSGYIDHSDSLGATARFGRGDVQWMTAGAGIVHSEMFPLVKREQPNPLELFQIWLNLPRADKMVAPYFTMLWSEAIPREVIDGTEVAVIAGQLGERRGPPPPPNSWAARAEAEVSILTLKMDAGGRFALPPASADANRTLYLFRGDAVQVAGSRIESPTGARLRPDIETPIVNGDAPAELLVLQGRPIGEPVVQYGPFVMNAPEEINQAIVDYRRTQFGGWPWPNDGPVHAREEGRFALHADGHQEKAG